MVKCDFQRGRTGSYWNESSRGNGSQIHPTERKPAVQYHTSKVKWKKKEMYASSSLTVRPVVLKTLRDLHQLQSLCSCGEIFVFVWIKSENIIQHFIIASMSTTNNHESQTTAPTFNIILSPNRYCHAVTDRVWAMKITAN